MEKFFVKKLDDGKEFKIMVKLINGSIALPFFTVCEYLLLNTSYWTKKMYSSLLCVEGEKISWIYISTLAYRLQEIKPKTFDGRYWKKVILDLTEHEILRSRSDSDKKGMELITQLRDSKAEKSKAESQLQKAEEELQQVKINLSNANDTIEFLTCKNKELKKQQRKLNQALGIDLLNMAQQLLNIKEV